MVVAHESIVQHPSHPVIGEQRLPKARSKQTIARRSIKRARPCTVGLETDGAPHPYGLMYGPALGSGGR